MCSWYDDQHKLALGAFYLKAITVASRVGALSVGVAQGPQEKTVNYRRVVSTLQLVAHERQLAHTLKPWCEHLLEMGVAGKTPSTQCREQSWSRKRRRSHWMTICAFLSRTGSLANKTRHNTPQDHWGGGIGALFIFSCEEIARPLVVCFFIFVDHEAVI